MVKIWALLIAVALPAAASADELEGEDYVSPYGRSEVSGPVLPPISPPG